MKKIFQNVIRHWYAYLLIGIFSFSISYYSLVIANRPKNEEKISLFIASYNSDTNSLSKYLEMHKPNYLRKTIIRTVVPTDSRFDSYVTSALITKSDIFVLPESKISIKILKESFAKLNDDMIKDYISTPDYFVLDDGDCVGIKCHQINQENNELIKYSSKDRDENYYMFFNNSSLHLGSINNSNYDTALEYAKLLIEYVI